MKVSQRKQKQKIHHYWLQQDKQPPVCNIYDMGGNVLEWTTESCSYKFSPYAMRGGDGSGKFAHDAAGYRINNPGDAYGNVGFRLTLFM